MQSTKIVHFLTKTEENRALRGSPSAREFGFAAAAARAALFAPRQPHDAFNGIPFVPQKFRNFPAILEHRKIQANPL